MQPPPHGAGALRPLAGNDARPRRRRQFPLTHEFLSTMLGIRRPSVTLALADLQRAGLIAYTRGQVTVRDRPALEALACECYHIVQKSYEALIG